MTANPEPAMLAVFDGGGRCLGHLLKRGGKGWEAFGEDNTSLGLHSDQATAAAALRNATTGGSR
jgi:hypothetical protein